MSALANEFFYNYIYNKKHYMLKELKVNIFFTKKAIIYDY